MKNIIVCTFLTILFFSSCKKEEDNNSCTTSVATIAGTYKLTAAKYKQAPASAESDALVLLSACKKDDLYIVAANGDFSYQDAGTICSPNGSYTGGQWTLSGNTIDLDGLYSGIIESFNCTILIFYKTDVNVPGDRVTVTFVKQ